MNSFEPQEVGDLAPGVQLGHYVLMEKIADGGVGTVYKAFEPALERFVAIKVLLPEFAQNEQYLQNFEAEALRVASIQHPHIVPIYYIGRVNQISFFSMAFVEGQTLDDWIDADKKLNLGESKWFLYQAVSALEYAARHQLIHLDIKPSNFLVDQKPMILLADFGLAQNISHSNNTEDNDIYGTPYYVSPEQIYRQKTDLRTDIYSLGATLFHLVVGQPPFGGDTIEEIIQGHIQKPFPYGLALASNLNIGLVHLIRKMMERNPDNRFQNYQEILQVLQDLERFRYESAQENDFKPIPRPPEELPSGKRDLAYGLLKNNYSEWSKAPAQINSQFSRAQILGSLTNRIQPLPLENSSNTFLEIAKGDQGNFDDLMEASEKFKGFQFILDQLSIFFKSELELSPASRRECLETIGAQKSQSLALLDFSLNHELPPSSYFHWTPLWQHQIAVAFILEDIYDLLGFKKTGIEFATGLFHDLGKIILADLYPLAFFNLMNRSIVDQLSLSRLELDLFGIHHGEIISYWLREKRFPNALIEAIEQHEAVEFNSKKSPLPHVLYCANQLARQLRLGYSGNGLFTAPLWEENVFTKSLWKNRKNESLEFENFTAFLISRYREFPILFKF